MAKLHLRPDFLELPVGDAEASRRFYAACFGWEMQSFGPTYACTMTGDIDVGVQADPAERSAAPLIVVRADDLEEAFARVEQSGGGVTRAIFAFPGGRRFHFRDPDGNEVAVYRPD